MSLDDRLRQEANALNEAIAERLDLDAGLADIVKRAQHEPGAGLPGIDALDRILAASGEPQRRQVPARFEHVGLALVLLITQPSTTHSRPLTRQHWTYVDGVVCTIAEAFVEALDQPACPVFWRGSALAGLRRLLGRALKVAQDEDGFASELRVINSDGAFERVAGFLRRRGVSASQAAAAFDVLVTIYRGHLPQLAGFGQGGERPPNTSRVRDRLVEALAVDRQRSDAICRHRGTDAAPDTTGAAGGER